MSRSTWYHNMNALKRVDRHAGLKDKSERFIIITKGIMATAESRSH
ncbi:hypothetical protein AC45_3971 [Escherichia coli 2-210-07_S3_C3]|nr:hypothetical protein AC45_3971 [Escherichia coli 2-210-07_S3_C3]